MTTLAHDPTAQRMRALERAQRLRLAGAHRRQEIKQLDALEGRGMVADMLEHPDEATLSLRVDRLLTAIRYVQTGHASRWMMAADVGSLRKVRQLTERQRLELARLVRGEIKATLEGPR